MSRNDGHNPFTSSGAISRSTAAADVNFTPRSSPHESRIPRWKSRSSPSLSDGGSNSNSNRGNTKDATTNEGTMEKRVASYNQAKGSSRASTPSQARKSGGFLLGSAFPIGPSASKDHAHRRPHLNGDSQTNVGKLAANRVSDASSQRSSPLSRNLSNDGHGESARAPSPRPPSMDPAQLVQMALNLSESRRRHMSSTLPVPVSPAGARRVVSGLAAGAGVVQAGTPNMSHSGHLNHESGRPASGSQTSSQQYGDIASGTVGGPEGSVFSFSPATLSRAEKARRYFELASEHRRLLEHLPPLKTDSSAPGNHSMKATSSPGSAHFDVTRIPSNTTVKRGLGRPYNPLQALRNRRLRNRERRPLTAPPDTWQETNRIKGWIDGVEAASKQPSFRPGEDQVRLPTFSGESEGVETSRSYAVKGHRRNDTVSSVITRPENGWTIEPAELLADTYWLEKDDNKTVVEDRHGNRIFPNRARLSVEVPRRSKESERRKGPETDKRGTADESEDDDRLRSRGKKMISIPGRLRRHHPSRPASVASSSSSEGRKPPALHFGDSEGGDENIGPLERHMKQMIYKEERGELSSPEIPPLNQGESEVTHFPRVRSDNIHQNSVKRADGRPSAEIQRSQRVRSMDGRVGSIDHGAFAMDETVSNSTASPRLSNNSAFDVTAPANKRNMASVRKYNSSNLPSFRSRSKERNHIEHNDFADNTGAQLSPVFNKEPFLIPSRSSLDSSRPMQMNRKGTNESTTGSMRRTNTRNTLTDGSIKDSANAVGRQLGRLGDLVRSEGSRLGDRLRGGRDRDTALGFPRAPSEASDADGAENSNMHSRSDNENGDGSPRQSLERGGSKPKYHTAGLPTFKSPAARDNSATEDSSAEKTPLVPHESSRPETARAAQKNLPAPPIINFPDSASVSDSDVPGTESSGNRLKSASQTHLSFGASPAIRNGERRGNLTSHDGRRHWSISDPSHQSHPQLLNDITARDIARVRALLLASGIKAQEIHHKAGSPRDAPLPLISKIADTIGQKLDGLTRKEENIVAGRLLSERISSTLVEFEKTLETFQSTTVKNLGAQLDELSHRAADQLTKLVHETSDEIDAFNVELTTKQPQEVKRVDEAVDEMLRERRRQFRLVRRTGFKLLEWLVLGAMWWAWLLVVLFNTFKKGLVAVFVTLRWLLWF